MGSEPLSERIRQLVEQPSESLSVELKRWIDPDENEGIAKIVKTAIALRNYGGGYIVIGFDNDTMKPDVNNVPSNVRTAFHVDKIQGMISKFSSETFEIKLHFVQREAQEYPVIEIPVGVKTPVATKSELPGKNGKQLIKPDTVYIRTLSANNTPSTTQATWKNWSQIIDICFENREADIGRFLRRHISGLNSDIIRQFLAGFSKLEEAPKSLKEKLASYLQESEARFQTITKERGITLSQYGSREVAFIIIGEVPPHFANNNFLNLLDSSNPKYTGWPIWLNSRGFSKEQEPYIFEETWEALVIEQHWGQSIDFMRFDPKGRFYARQALEDDLSRKDSRTLPLVSLDPSLHIIRTVEAIAVGIEFARAMGCNPENTQLAFAFKWGNLQGRKLVSWARPKIYTVSADSAYQNEVLTFVDIPLDTPRSALAQYVSQAVSPLLRIFGGFEFSIDVYEDLTQRLIERKI